jgi:membrane protease YdiL (CAAX protease family)
MAIRIPDKPSVPRDPPKGRAKSKGTSKGKGKAPAATGKGPRRRSSAGLPRGGLAPAAKRRTAPARAPDASDAEPVQPRPAPATPPQPPVAWAPPDWTAAQPRRGAPQPGPGFETVAPAAEARRRGGWATFWDVVLAIDLGLLGLLFLFSLLFSILQAADPAGPLARRLQESEAGLGAGELAANALVILVMGGLVPAAWVAGTRVRAWQGLVAYLGLRRPLPRFGLGVAWGLAAIAASWIVVALYIALYAAVTHQGFADAAQANRSPVSQGIASIVTPGLALLVAASAALGEETLFRGLLQRRIGIWGQAILFGLVHAGYGTIPQIVVPFGLGWFFGYLYRRTGSLWIPIGAHFTFDYVQLLLVWASRFAPPG